MPIPSRFACKTTFALPTPFCHFYDEVGGSRFVLNVGSSFK